MINRLIGTFVVAFSEKYTDVGQRSKGVGIGDMHATPIYPNIQGKCATVGSK